jgi:diadenosine tetraphosphate (Ap4A) HIT family hydrolase
MKDCIFCKIAKGEIPSETIWEDKRFFAILDINPNTEGMTILITKKHYESYAFNMPDGVYKEFFLAAKKVTRILEKGLKVKRVSLVMEGMGVNHAHIKIYPMHGLEDKFKETVARERVFFEKYPGYISTRYGPQADSSKLKKVAEKIKRNNN